MKKGIFNNSGNIIQSYLNILSKLWNFSLQIPDKIVIMPNLH